MSQAKPLPASKPAIPPKPVRSLTSNSSSVHRQASYPVDSTRLQQTAVSQCKLSPRAYPAAAATSNSVSSSEASAFQKVTADTAPLPSYSMERHYRSRAMEYSNDIYVVTSANNSNNNNNNSNNKSGSSKGTADGSSASSSYRTDSAE